MKVLSLVKRPPPDCNSPLIFKSGVLNRPPEYLEKPLDLNKFRNVYDWHFMFLNSGKNSPDLRIFLGKFYFTNKTILKLSYELSEIINHCLQVVVENKYSN